MKDQTIKPLNGKKGMGWGKQEVAHDLMPKPYGETEEMSGGGDDRSVVG